MKGLGAAVIQDGYPVTFASNPLDSTRSNYPNIDREILGRSFGSHGPTHTSTGGRSR